MLIRAAEALGISYAELDFYDAVLSSWYERSKKNKGQMKEALSYFKAKLFDRHAQLNSVLKSFDNEVVTLKNYRLM